MLTRPITRELNQELTSTLTDGTDVPGIDNAYLLEDGFFHLLEDGSFHLLE